jgi:hypothetical protein
MEDEKKGPGRPALTEVYCTTSLVKTSKGTFHHGDRVKLPQEEAAALKKRGFVQ